MPPLAAIDRSNVEIALLRDLFLEVNGGLGIFVEIVTLQHI